MPDSARPAVVRSGLTRRIITGVVAPAVILMALYALGMLALGIRQHESERRSALQQLASRQSSAIATLAERLALPVQQTGTLVTLFPMLGADEARIWLGGVLARNALPYRIGYRWRDEAGSPGTGHWLLRDRGPAAAHRLDSPLPSTLLAVLATVDPGAAPRWLTAPGDAQAAGPGQPPALVIASAVEAGAHTAEIWAEIRSEDLAAALIRARDLDVDLGAMVLLDADQRVLLHPDPKLIGAPFADWAAAAELAPLLAAGSRGRIAQVTQWRVGERVRAVAQRLPATGWTLLTALPDGSNAYGVSGRDLINAGFVLVALAFVIVGAGLASRRIVTPLKQLTLGVQRLAQGERSFQRVDDDGSEVGVLANAFGTLAAELALREASLRQHEEELLTANRDLELRVWQRTVELSEARDAAMAATRAKSDFLATMSHEIRTPMNGLIGMLDLLGSSPLNAQQAQQVEIARSSAAGLMQVLNDILDFSKIEAGKLDIDPVPTDLRRVITEVVAVLGWQAAQKELPLRVVIADRVPDLLVLDPARLKQCLFNLVGNAIKFTAQGEIVVEADLADGPPDGDAFPLAISVRDSGIGIDPATAERLFEPFSQADNSIKRRYGGTGLGLSIVRRLVELMGGSIGVESEPGRGATFRFTILARAAQDVAAPLREVADRRGYRVLVCSPQADERARLAGLLGEAGLRVASCDHADDALALLATPGWALAVVACEPLAALMAGTADHHPPLLVIGEPPAGARGQPWLHRPVRLMALLAAVDRLLADAAEPTAADRAAVQAEAAVIARKPTVLLVEDSPVNRLVARGVLTRLGCHVELAMDGAEAVAAHAELNPALVLMDVQMPVMDGLAATRELRRRETRGRVPIVGLTANVMEDQIRDYLAAGMDEVLPKPLDLPRLRELLARIGLDRPDLAATGRASPPPAAVASPPAPAADPGAQAVDLGRLAATADGDEAFLAELVETLLASTRGARGELATAAAAGDRVRLARLGHRLAGMAASAGAAVLQAAAQRLERSALDRPDDASASALAVAATTVALDRTIAEVEAWWQGRAGA